MEFAYTLILTALSMVTLYAILIIAMKIKLKRLERIFGGKVTANSLRPTYVLDDIKLVYGFGSEGMQGFTTIKVAKRPKKPIHLELSPKMYLFKNKEKTFEDLYNFECNVHDGFSFLTDDLKYFLVRNYNSGMVLVLNQNDFTLTTENSPFYIKKIEKCIELLLKIRKRINEYETNVKKRYNQS